MERTPREGHARDRSGWFWSRSGLSGLGRQVLVRTTEPEITNLPVFYLSDRLAGQVQTELDPHAMIVEFLKKLVDDIEEIAGQTFDREPDSAVYEELDLVDRCVWTLLLLQGELIPGLRHKCLMCKRTAEPILISLQRDQALMGVRVEGTVMKLSLMANRRDYDPPKLCGFHDFELTLALNAIVRVVPRHDIRSSGRHLSSQLVSWFLAKFVNPDIPLEI
ncbi:hypothetical protein M758_6G114300 [Ceratodon purpureus]|nr:hypothetical protein M758_6G114300 [Ceratodon purpureus]